MNLSISLHKTPNFPPTFSTPTSQKLSILPPPSHTHQIPFDGRSSKLWPPSHRLHQVLGAERGKWGPKEGQLEDDDEVLNLLEEEEKEWVNEIIEQRWREKCKKGGERGIVELMECLEREAIMGEDQGKDASDYKRRAHIFHKSARVFQALKEKSSPQAQC